MFELAFLVLVGPPVRSADVEPVEVHGVEPPIESPAESSTEPPIEPPVEARVDPPVEIEDADPPEAPADPAPAVDTESTDERPNPSPTWQARLFVDVGYAFNSNIPDNHVYRGMFTNPRTNELAVNAVGAFVRHPATDEEPWSVELGLHAGAAVDSLTSGEPVAGGDDGQFAGAEVFKHIALANAGFRARRTKTSIAAGVFEGPMGIGSFWTANNWNYTTSWESNVVPYYLAGGRIAQELPGGVELSGWVVNGFQAYSDANSVPSGQVGLAWSPERRERKTQVSGASHVYFGPEGESLAAADWLVYWDTWAALDIGERAGVAAVWDLGVDRVGRSGDARSLYTGGALFVRGVLVDRDNLEVDLSLRPEASWDRDGRFFGVDQWLLSGTGTLGLRAWDHLLLRAEYRYDHSTAADGFFYRGTATNPAATGLARSQHLVSLSLTAWWDFWFSGAAKR